MRLNRLGLALPFVIVAFLVSVAPAANAGTEGGGDLEAEAKVTTTSVVTSTTDVPIRCVRSRVEFLENGRHSSGRFVYTYVDAMYWRYDPETGETWIRSYEVCRRGTVQVSSEMVWDLVSAPNPEIVADVLYDRAVKDIDAPDPALSPVGPGVVNLGMWLAVNDPGPYSVTAAVPGLSVTVSAQLVETRFDMGNGDVVVCAGAGDPIPEAAKDSVEPSPTCGYTYVARPDDHTATITVTSTWAVSWTSSNGDSGTRPAIPKTSSVEYEILEIQTVGQSNN